jgi:hypothetical protein
MDELIVFLEHGPNRTIWTLARIPQGVRDPKGYVDWLRRGGRPESHLVYVPERARLTPRIIGDPKKPMTVIVTVEGSNELERVRG